MFRDTLFFGLREPSCKAYRKPSDEFLYEPYRKRSGERYYKLSPKPSYTPSRQPSRESSYGSSYRPSYTSSSQPHHGPSHKSSLKSSREYAYEPYYKQLHAPSRGQSYEASSDRSHEYSRGRPSTSSRGYSYELPRGERSHEHSRGHSNEPSYTRRTHAQYAPEIRQSSRPSALKQPSAPMGERKTVSRQRSYERERPRSSCSRGTRYLQETYAPRNRTREHNPSCDTHKSPTANIREQYHSSRPPNAIPQERKEAVYESESGPKPKTMKWKQVIYSRDHSGRWTRRSKIREGCFT